VHLFESLHDHQYFDGDWHYERDEVVVNAFVDNIRNDIRYGCMSQSGARVFEKQEYKDEVGIMSLGAADSDGQRIYLRDAHGLGSRGTTSVNPDRWGACNIGAYSLASTLTFETRNPNLSGEEDPERSIEIPWGRTPRVMCDCSNFSFRAEKFEAWKLDLDWLTRKEILESLGSGVILGEKVLFNFRYVVPVDQIVKWLGQNAIANSFVSRTITANLTSSNEKLHSTWDATDRMCESPYIVKKLVDGDHFANRIEIVEWPDVKGCAVIMTLLPHAVSRECRFADIDSMFGELFFHKEDDSFSFGKKYKVKMYLEEHKRPLEDLLADENSFGEQLGAILGPTWRSLGPDWRIFDAVLAHLHATWA
jgi:hypothetical protein